MKYLILIFLLVGCCQEVEPIVLTPRNYYSSIEEFSRTRGASEYKEAVLIHLRDIGNVDDINKLDSIYSKVEEYYLDLEEDI